MKLQLEIDLPESRFESVYRHIVQTEGRLSELEAAGLVHLSISRFSSEFKRRNGITFRAARIDAKLRIAAVLLSSTHLRVSEIASRLGYSEVKKFGKAFKQKYGVPPTVFRLSQHELHRSCPMRARNCSGESLSLWERARRSGG
jgi:AraC-like DNA-binding protein